jgi:membrane protein DedA with SNARE-associated domain
MNDSNKPSEKMLFLSDVENYSRVEGDKHASAHKYWHYIFVISVLLILLSALALLNAYFHLINISSYDINREGVSSSFFLGGYIGMFISIAILPVPDYFLVPAYGYLSSIGVFNPYSTFLVCLAAALFPVEYVCGRLAARPLMVKVLSLFRISEKDIETADKWLVEHGKFSIFISTFIPFFYSLASLAAGTLKMNVAGFFLSSSAGFGLRFAFLECVGYYSIYIFTASFDYSQRTLFFSILILSSVYAAFHLARTLARKRIK